MADDQTLPTSFQMSFEMELPVDAADIAAKLTPAQVLNLIQEIDDEVGHWELTLALSKYFEMQVAVARTTVPDLAALSLTELTERLNEIPAGEAG